MAMDWTSKWSMESRGSRRQIGAATALMAILPNMVICYVFLFSDDDTYSLPAKLILGGLVCLLAVSGYLLLNRYPKKVSRLRQYLKQIAEGELPEKIVLHESENDVRDVEEFLNIILEELRKKVALLESQQEELLEAERHRVMINSLGAACHHIGQPASILRAHLHFLKGQVSGAAELNEIRECEQTVDSIAEILDKLRGVSEYRTVPYRTFPVEGPPGDDMEILDIEKHPSLDPASAAAPVRP